MRESRSHAVRGGRFAAFATLTTLTMVATLLAGATPYAVRAQTIDTRDGAVIAGIVTTPLFGQTFTAPAGAGTLLQFSFFLRSNVSPGAGAVPTTFRAFLFDWTGAAVAGPARFVSPLQQASLAPGVHEVSFAPGLAVAAGEQFAAVILPDDGTQVHGVTRDAGGAPFDSYAGGAAISAVCGGAASLPDCLWFATPTYDRAFTATFAPVSVPEPSTAALLLLGGSVLFLSRRRRLAR